MSSKKDLSSLTTDLSALAAQMPTQRSTFTAPAAVPPPAANQETPALAVVAPSKPKTKIEEEKVTQFSLSLRKDLRKQLARLADEADMTMRAFVLNALKAKGLAVRSDDLVDLRRERH